jgi:hypothetical protein
MGTEAEEGERDCDGAATVDTDEGRRVWQRTPGFIAIGGSVVRGTNWTSSAGLRV